MTIDPTLNLAAAAACFVGIHLFVSGTRLRDRIVGAIGEGPYAGLFSLASLGCIIWLSVAFSRASGATLTVLWIPQPWWQQVAMAVTLVAFVLAVLGLTAKNPTSAGQAGLVDDPDIAKGIVRVTRHPFLFGALLWALTHIAVNGDVASLIFFGTFAVLGVAGPPSIDAKRARALGPRWQPFAQKTSIVPFAAIVSGRNSLKLGEIGVARPLAAVAIYLAFLFGHKWLFGVAAFGR